MTTLKFIKTQTPMTALDATLKHHKFNNRKIIFKFYSVNYHLKELQTSYNMYEM
jgi:hypothetical protein